MAIDLDRAEARARRAYELGRARGALLLATPLAVLAVLAGFLGHRPLEAALIGSVLYVTGLLFHWRGRDLGAAVLPGAAAGLVPLGVGLLIRAYGCVGGCSTSIGCMAFCIPASAVAGAVAGFLVAGASIGRPGKTAFLVSGGTIAMLTGALGCACIGIGGLLGLAAGVSIPVGVGLARLAIVRSS
jgi:hypothetical protein